MQRYGKNRRKMLLPSFLLTGVLWLYQSSKSSVGEAHHFNSVIGGTTRAFKILCLAKQIYHQLSHE